MKFGNMPLRDAQGGILAHSVTIEGRSVRKGRRLDEALVNELLAAGVTSLFVAMPEDGRCPGGRSGNRGGPVPCRGRICWCNPPRGGGSTSLPDRRAL